MHSGVAMLQSRLQSDQSLHALALDQQQQTAQLLTHGVRGLLGQHRLGQCLHLGKVLLLQSGPRLVAKLIGRHAMEQVSRRR